MAAPATPPNAPSIDRSRSSLTSLFVTWDRVAQGDIPIDGYLLYMIVKGSGESSLAYDGSFNPDTTNFLITSLQTGEYYALYLQSVNFNGVSQPGRELVAPVCLAPNHIESVKYISSTKSSINVGWTTPTYTGGCPLLSYSLYINNGLGGSLFSEVNPAQINDKPYITNYDVTGLTHLGNFYKFKITVKNEIGTVESLPKDIKLAAVPDTPPVAPYQDFTETNSE